MPHRGNSLPGIAEAEQNGLDFKEHQESHDPPQNTAIHTLHPIPGVSLKSTRCPQEARKKVLEFTASNPT